MTMEMNLKYKVVGAIIGLLIALVAFIIINIAFSTPLFPSMIMEFSAPLSIKNYDLLLLIFN